jgi:DNA invertase Pin-like site-specific DNA recombinase
VDLEIVLVQRDEGSSAKTLKRPKLIRALEMIENGEADGILVTKLDRLTRSVRDMGDLVENYFGEKPGKVLLSVGEQIDTRSATGRLIMNVLSSVAQWEREIISERTRAAMGHLKGQGRHTGGHVPYGFVLADDGQHLEPLEAEQAVIRMAIALHEGGASLSSIARKLTSDGTAAKNGGAWQPTQVKRILTRGKSSAV